MRTFAKNMGINLQIGVNLELPEQFMVGRREACAAFGGVAAVNTFLDPCTEAGDLLIMHHEAARDAMKAKCPHLAIGITLSLHDIQPVEGGEEVARQHWAEEFTHYLPYLQKDDFSDCRTTPERWSMLRVSCRHRSMPSGPRWSMSSIRRHLSM